MNEITTFLTAWADAERDRDTEFLEANLTDDFVGVGPLGFQLPKPAWLARHRGDDLRYEMFDLDEVADETPHSIADEITDETQDEQTEFPSLIV